MLPFDATGAGDAFSAGFLAGEARGFPPERCLRLGNRIAEEVLRVSGSAADPARLRAAADSVGG
jgi:adenosine kinase